MKLHYQAHRSRLVEYLYFPGVLLRIGEAVEEGFSQKEKELFREDLEVLASLKDTLKPFEEAINRRFLWGKAFSVLHLAYFLLLERGKEPRELEELYEEILALSKEDIEELFRTIFSEESAKRSDKPLLTLLEESWFPAEFKWYWSLALARPLEAIQEVVALHRQLAELYHPFYEQAQERREAFAGSFDLAAFCEATPDIALPKVDGKPIEEAQFMVLSPWLTFFCFYGKETYTNLGLIFCASVGIEQLFYSREDLDIDDLVTILKTVSDATRYQVMQALVEPHAKSKEIAKQLGITGAAVSFHTQKLINSQLLLFSKEDSSKFEVNKRLLQQVIERLQEDFGLLDKS